MAGRLTDNQIKEAAKIKHSFPEKCYPSDMIEKQCQQAFIDGVKWMQEKLREGEK